MSVKCITKALGTVAAVALLAGISASARAVVFNFEDGAFAASAEFTTSGNVLTITLTNTSTTDVLSPSGVLTGLFFDTGSTALTPQSALLASGSTVHFGPDGGGNVGGEWAYKYQSGGLTAGIDPVTGLPIPAPGGATQGISSAGLGIFGDPNFGGTNLQDPTGVDGLNYGITSAGDDLATGNTPVTGGVALIKNAVVFTLLTPDGFDLTKIENVSWQYGTSLSEPNHRFGPEPAFFQMAGFLGMGGLSLLKLRRRRK